MSKIQIYARIRPTNHQRYHRHDGFTSSENRIHLKVGEVEESGSQTRFSRAPGTKHEFKFDHVFEEDATQEEVFDIVAKKVVDSFLVGYNGTIFAYGQTSSGKTYTIEGSGRKFAERGLIPRILSCIYKGIERLEGEGEEVSVHVSHLEIYQDTGYDLLNPGMRPGALMVTLPKVHIAEGPSGEVVVRHLSSHLAATEEVAQSLLFQGSTCRKVAETSMNQCSSRSHSVFAITLTARAQGSEVITKSKLNLVDLAGSERVAKTGAGGRILQEAKHINLSLHHLEHVIVALQQQSRQGTSRTPLSPRSGPVPNSPLEQSHGTTDNLHGSRKSSSLSRGDSRVLPSRSRGYSRGDRHGSPRPTSRGGGRSYIPYRNCMLTMVLRDSLGGNCLTAMIATLSADEGNILETISTCRFSQRVACIANKARRNEELDDKAVIKRLKQRVAELEKEVAELRQGTANSQQMTVDSQSATESLTDSEKQLCHRVLYGFFHGKIDNPVAAGIDTVAKFQECLSVLRGIVLHALGITGDSSSFQPHSTPPKGQSSERDWKNGEKLANELRTGLVAGGRGEGGGGRGGLKQIPPPIATEVSTPGDHNITQVRSQKHNSTSPERRSEASTAKSTKAKLNSTPSPNSRLSSGFASLQDEDGSLFESGYMDFFRQSGTTDHGTTGGPVKVSPRSHPSRQTHSKLQHGNENQSQTHGESVNSTHSRQVYRNQSPSKAPNQAASPGNQDNPSQQSAVMAGTSLESSTGQTSHQVQSKRGSSNPTSEKAQILTVQSLRNHDHQQHPSSSHSFPFTGDTSLLHPSPYPKPLSPRQHQALQQLGATQDQLQRSEGEQRKLVSEVQLLNLKVQEEELRSLLFQIGEQLASQHMRVLGTQQGGATAEQLCAERIAEQQLRIKQAKVHQKLLDVQHQMKMMNFDPRTPHIPATSPITVSATPLSPPASLSPHSPTARITTELAKHQRRQSKVQEQIEKLMLSQMEKQLELKEVATRRKLLALKQQLQAGSSQSSSQPMIARFSSSAGPPYTHNYHKLSKPPATAPGPGKHITQNPVPKTVPRSKSERFGVSVDGAKQWMALGIRSTDEVGSTTPKRKELNSTFATPPGKASSHHQEESVKTPRSAQRGDSKRQSNASPHTTEHDLKLSSSPEKFHATASKSTTSTPTVLTTQQDTSRGASSSTRERPKPILSETKKHLMPSTPPEIKTLTSHHTQLPLRPSHSSATVPRKPVSPSVSRQAKVRLSLPDEVKETEYMTALQRQKARVSRIRRCIVAATIVQRAWRGHKEKTLTMNRN